MNLLPSRQLAIFSLSLVCAGVSYTRPMSEFSVEVEACEVISVVVGSLKSVAFAEDSGASQLGVRISHRFDSY